MENSITRTSVRGGLAASGAQELRLMAEDGESGALAGRRARARRFPSTPLPEHGASRARRFPSTALHEHAASRARRFPSTALHEHAASRARRFTSTPLPEHAASRARRFPSTPLPEHAASRCRSNAFSPSFSFSSLFLGAGTRPHSSLHAPQGEHRNN
ncbi:hypothetical protein EYF80_064746 [Liparis tanakae]|uniref:Uncharacterized protein n=1 Tax=Liparis tanakae TaxID=230148 RepID=A0A4Z2E881_9TELE|nr:hypothetical protein EYF80_064746 [Liparis tanakae]